MLETLTVAILSLWHKISVEVASTLIGSCEADTVTSYSLKQPLPSFTVTE